MLVFAVETSCDETSVCIMKDDKTILSHIIYSQEIHKKHGGVVPELASRAHLEILQNITKQAFKKTKINPGDIDIYAATCGPGLIGALLVGSTFTKALSIGAKKPFVPINHLEGHLFSPTFNNKILFPHLSLLITGGHTQIYLINNKQKITLLGESIDDAVGEAFDKVAKLLGLSYPGGQEIEKKAKKGDENFFKLPQPLISEDNSNFSFSGLKTSVNLIIKKNKINYNFINNMSASFQKCIADILSVKLDKTIKKLIQDKKNLSSVSVVGGVANNNYIKSKILSITKKHNLKLVIPPRKMLCDNAAMIAWTCIYKYSKGDANIFVEPNPRLTIN
ncbi:MAG: tRNA N6-adenosine threonylcarbamoyltransferase [Alphaproteobacteria bacterium MarineAlpha5_Bin5]|nr:MAG: tRNA N6-adenosine threonylcarbamoyltransferase [Alphaproteobacteria bacterium MarineAlpha5_Bin5]|tara:strand:+ start:8252 stop:9256 length:1005 start_codon:yes stop_codon:yes gene_type:complete